MPFRYIQQRWTFQEIKRYCACDDETVHFILAQFGKFVDPTLESSDKGGKKGSGKNGSEETFTIGIAELTPLTLDNHGKLLTAKIYPDVNLRFMCDHM